MPHSWLECKLDAHVLRQIGFLLPFLEMAQTAGGRSRRLSVPNWLLFGVGDLFSALRCWSEWTTTLLYMSWLGITALDGSTASLQRGKSKCDGSFPAPLLASLKENKGSVAPL